MAVTIASDSTLLTSFGESIHGAKALKTEYVLQQLGGLRDEYSVVLKKPNLVRIDSPSQLVVADGKEVVTLDKQAKTFYRQPETPQVVKGLFQSEPLTTWAGFFDPAAYQSKAARDLGVSNKGGKDYEAVESQLDTRGNKTITYFLDPSDKIARQVEFNAKHGSDVNTTILRTRSLVINGSEDDSLFAFKAPEGSSEVSLADVLSGKWYLTLAEAEKVAATTHKKIFIDFMATWCGPCKLLQHQVLETENFKKAVAAKGLVLCRIDTDLNPDLMMKYNITAIPVQAVVDEKGNMLSQTVGYGDPQSFYSWLDTAAPTPRP